MLNITGIAYIIWSDVHKQKRLAVAQAERQKYRERKRLIDDYLERFKGNIIYPFGKYASSSFCYNIISFKQLDYDPYSKIELYDSFKEKQDAFIKENRLKYASEYKYYRNAPKFILDYVVFNGRWAILDSERKLLGIKEDDDEYSYVMPDSIFEVVVKLIRWEGEQL